MKVGLLLAGSSTDMGFMQSGFDGLKGAEGELGINLSVFEGVKPEQADMEKSLRKLAEASPDLIVVHGGQNAKAATNVVGEFPKVMFVVTQSDVVGPNLTSYEVLQEESAWLAGAAAGLLTKTNTVGHMSGIRVTPGLKGRAAYVNGVAHTNPQAKVLPNFPGNQDDVELAPRLAAAEISAGADYIFTMLNAGRPGVAQAIDASGGKAREFGNVRDFTQDDPKISVGSAVADSGAAAFAAVKDFVRGDFKADTTHLIGLEDPEAVRLTLADDVPQTVRDKIKQLTSDIVAKITVAIEYSGPEFPTP
ncbi:BMP family protein [Arthrobacter sp. H14-L1]|uniref:BMP family protein n=1 Tax=Arthrobacter sp. H14-L1 TaxID=2996697 RepID=UPI00226F7459|nr:BMP family protein [Arthrobacter sp. H14-L1]MCY0905530.1 BMP family protein [Arthrobacter sp. H14-L1]